MADPNNAEKIDGQFMERVALDGLSGNPAAMSSVKWDRVVDRRKPDGTIERIGFSDKAQTAYDIPVDQEKLAAQYPQEAQAEPVRGTIKQVIENGVSYDVETKPDGSEWLLGRTGEAPGVAFQMKPPTAATEAGLGTAGAPAGADAGAEQPAGPEQPAQPAAKEEPGMFSEVGLGILSGANKAVEEIAKTTRLNEVADWLEERIPLGSINVPLPSTTAGNIAEGLTQGGVAMLPAARITKALAGVGSFLRWTATGALVDFGAFSPDDPGIGDLAKELGNLDNKTLEAVRSTIAESLAKDVDDGEFEKRLKNVGGGVLAGVAFDGISALYKAARRLGKLPPVLKSILGTGAVGAAIEPDQAEGGVLSKAAGLFSKALKTIETGKIEKGTGQQWLGALKNAGVKDEELSWTGLDEFLKSKPTATREEVASFMRDNQVQVQEIVKGSNTQDALFSAENAVVEQARREGMTGGRDAQDYALDAARGNLSEGQQKMMSPEMRPRVERLRAAYEARNAGDSTPTKFSAYQLPGGESYRELLLTLPVKTSNEGNAAALFARSMREKYGERWIADAPAADRARYDELIAAQESMPVQPEMQNFRGGHFDEPNVLAHVRFNDRVDADGKRVLFIEEIQSDWHQRGRKFGYQSEYDTAGWTAKRDPNGYARDWIIYDANNNIVGYRAADSESEAIDLATRNMATGEKNSVPDAPFKTTWSELAMKRMIAYAAENGYDRIAWTTGKQQAERYDLSKQISKIEYEPAGDGLYEVHAFDLAGKRVLEEDEIPLDRVEELLGKEIAEKIESGVGAEVGGAYRQWRELSGLDLKVGGEGMAAFYDKMLVNTANKLGKKFGAKVGETDLILTTKPKLPLETLEQGIAEGMLEKATVHSLDLTQPLKEVATTEGFPLFSAAAVPIAAAPAFAQDQQPQGDGEVQVAGLWDRILSRAVREAGDLAAPLAKRSLTPTPGEIALETMANKVVPVGRISTTEQAMAAFDVVAKRNEIEIERARRGTVSLEETKAAGRAQEQDVLDLMGSDKDSPLTFMQNLASETKNLDARLFAAREFLTASMEETVKRAEAITTVDPSSVSPRQLFDYVEQSTRHRELQTLFTGARAEIGRALGSFRQVAEAAPGGGTAPVQTAEKSAQIIQETISQAGGADAIIEQARLLLATPAEKRGRLVKKMKNATALDVVREIYITNLLWGLKTQERNVFGTQLYMAWQVPTRLAAGAVGAIRRNLGGADDGAYMNEATALMVGYLEGFPAAARLAWKVMKSGQPADALTKMENTNHAAISSQRLGVDSESIFGRGIDVYGTLQRLPGRFLLAADEFNKGVAHQMERRAQAVRMANQALDQGKTVDEAARRFADAMAGDIPEVEEAVQSFGDVVTFTRQLGSSGQAVQKLLQKIPGGFLLAPFVRTPINLIKEFSYNSPLALVSPQFYRDIKAGGAARDLAIAKFGVGTGAIMWSVDLASRGIITGNGPTNTKQRQIWLQKYQPYSINVRKLFGDEKFKALGLTKEWISYQGLSPIGDLLAVGADYAQFKMWVSPDDLSQEDDEMLTANAVGTTLRVAGEKTWLMSIGEAAEAWKEPERFFNNWAANIASRAVPIVGSTMSGDIARAQDPVLRDTQIDPNENNPAKALFYLTLNKIKARTPGWSDSLPPRLNFWGEEIPAFDGNWTDAFNVFAPRSAKNEPIDDELIRLRQPWGMPPRKAFGIKLTPEQNVKMVKAMNTITSPNAGAGGKEMTLRERLNWQVKSAAYTSIPTIEDKVAILTRIKNKYLEGARMQMIDPASEFYDPQLASDSMANRANPGTPDFLQPQP